MTVEMKTPEFLVRAGGATDAGRVRQGNEDAFLIAKPVFLVADGMGGHKGGAEASRIVADEFAAIGAETWLQPSDVGDALARAAARIGAGGGGPLSAGSTVCGVGQAHQSGRAYWLVFNVGDSRTYRLADGTLEQVTVDHTRVQELVDAGRLDASAVSSHSQRNLITRAVGAGSRSAPPADLWLIEAGKGDRMLICSDGLTGELTDKLITATLLANAEPARAAEELVRRAVEAGGRDNVTAVVVDAVEVSHVGGPAWTATVGEDTKPDLVALPGGEDTLPSLDLIEGA